MCVNWPTDAEDGGPMVEILAEVQARISREKLLRGIDKAYKPRIICDPKFFRKWKICAIGACVVPSSEAY